MRVKRLRDEVDRDPVRRARVDAEKRVIYKRMARHPYQDSGASDPVKAYALIVLFGVLAVMLFLAIQAPSIR